MDIHLKTISKSFCENVVLDKLSYIFEENVNYRVIGNNGAGKTTLFKIMAGILDVDQGHIEVSNKSNIGWVSSTELGLFGRLTGRENINVLSRLIHHKNEQELELLITEWSESNTFKEALDTQFFKCSSGMKQVLKIFCAIIHKPHTLIMDEPFRNLDFKTRNQIAEILSNTKFLKSIIFSDHFYQENILENSISLSLEKGKIIDFN
jgi:ABC-type multidrug transport system ATPase subunit